MSKINNRILIVEDVPSKRYVLESVKEKFDDIYVISDYLQPISDVVNVIDSYGRLPKEVYTEDITPQSPKPLKTGVINKVKYVKLQDMDLGENNAYFVVGKLSWYYLRDFHSCHIGLRNTKLDWQVPHLQPFSLGTNKFVFCHETTDEFYTQHMEYFFDDDRLLKTVEPLKSSKVLVEPKDILKALKWAKNQPKGTRFGLDYETNGLWRNDKYENLEIIGFGIATKNLGFYVETRFLEGKDLEDVKTAYKEFLDIHEDNIWVFNVDFEIMATRKFLGPGCVYEFKDADVWRIIYGDQIGYSKKSKEVKRYGSTYTTMEKVPRDQRWSLKYTAQKYLNVSSWDNEFEGIENVLNKIFYGYKYDSLDELLMDETLSPVFKKWSQGDKIKPIKLNSLVKKLCKSSKILSWQDILDIVPEELLEDVDRDSWEVVFFGCKTPGQVLEHPEWKRLMKKYSDYENEFKELIKLPRWFGNPYSCQPSDIVGKYCIIDSYYTVMISETLYEKDDFKFNPNKPVEATWASTEKIVDIFAANKSLGGLMNLYGLYKSNSKRDSYNTIQERARIFCNYVVAKGYYKLILDRTNIVPPSELTRLNLVTQSCLKYGVDPKDFNRITKTLFKYIYDPKSKYGWNVDNANKILGEDIQEEILDILLSHKKEGLVDEKVHSRSTNLHKECGGIIENEFNSLYLPEDFDWKACRDYYNKIGNIQISKDKLECLETFNIKGKTLNQVIKTKTFTYDCLGETISENTSEMLHTLKTKFFDIATATELELGKMFEVWKDFRIFLFMYNKESFKEMVDNIGILSDSTSINTSVNKFIQFVDKVISDYNQPKLYSWEEAYSYYKENNLKGVEEPNEIEFNSDALQANAYIDKVISADVFKSFGVSKKFVDTYVWYRTIDEKMMEEEKEWMVSYKNASPLSYNDKFLSKALLCKMYDEACPTPPEKSLLDSMEICDIPDKINLSYYPRIATLFKLYRKYDKLGQYLKGQLVDSDYELLSEDPDGVPNLGPMSKEERHSSKKGDKVKMFPRYEIMQKFTKRNSSGIHTVPSSSETKGVIVAPEDQFLVYTDISSMELRGIAAVSKDETMIDYFESGKDIYTEAAMAYHVDLLKKDMTYKEVRYQYRNPYKIGVISTIYTATDPTLAKSYGVEVFEVKHIKNAIFSKFKRLYEWQQEQVKFNKLNKGFIRSFMGDIVRTYGSSSKQGRQAVNACIQGACSLIATAGFRNIVTQARKKGLYLPPAVIVHKKHCAL